MKHILNNQKGKGATANTYPARHMRGFVVSIITFFVLIIMLSIAVSMSAIIAARQKISTNSVKSTQSYYAAESGAEDALLRLAKNPSLSTLSYSLAVGGATANVVIPVAVGGARAIASKGDAQSRVRDIQVVYSIDANVISFYYGVQVGEGGLAMSNGSRIMGNVFSNGNITGRGTIDNDVIVAGNGHSLQDAYVGGDAQTYSCLSGASVENLTYVTGGSHTCTVRGTTSSQSDEIPLQAMPISQDQIDAFKAEAEAGGTVGNTTISGTQSLGPKKIAGNLTIANNATLTLTGTLYVTGQIVTNNNSTIELSSSYGALGGIIIADGTITGSNNAVLTGSGQSGSYLMLISTSSSDSAISINNNVAGAVFYASSGTIQLSNNTSVKELTGYRISLGNNAVIEYDSGLQNVLFSNGPSGGWKVQSWTEQQ